MTSTGIRNLKKNLSRTAKSKDTPSRFDELVASGVIRPPLEPGDATEGWPDIHLPAGTTAELIDADRGEE